MEFRENEAIYSQVANFVTEHIMLGKWLPEQKIPSVRELASDLQVNPHTVVRAYEILQSREVISNKRGIGFFIRSHLSSARDASRRPPARNQGIPQIDATG